MTEPFEVAAGPVEELAAGTVRLLEAAGRRLAVGNAGGQLFALDDTCLHRGGSLACGHLDGEILTCPQHWWRYDVRSGRRLGQPGLRVATTVRVVDGEVRCRHPAPAAALARDPARARPPGGHASESGGARLSAGRCC